MIIAVLKETADYERRVALTPPAAQKLTADGTKIKMEKAPAKRPDLPIKNMKTPASKLPKTPPPP